MNANNNKHEFALYCANLDEFLTKNANPGQTIQVDDADLLHRIKNVLRLEPGEIIVLFDEHVHAAIELEIIDKKKCTGRLINQERNHALKPAIIFLLPVLKKESLEEAIYAATELGATKVQLIKTAKMHHHQWREHDMVRLNKIKIAAAEQSKNFSMPIIEEPKELSTVLKNIEKTVPKIFFDPAGKTALKVLAELHEKKPSKLYLMVGPEADLTEQEKGAAQEIGFELCALTPTVLRAQQAVVVGLGLIRVCLK